MITRGIANAAAALLGTLAVWGQNAQKPSDDAIMGMTLEDVLRIEVTSVSKHSEKLWETAAAAFVITGDDIRRSGARSFPEILRMAPGMTVSRINTSSWGNGIRGLADRYSPYLLVLIDGRSLWNVATSAIEWSNLDYLLEDVERIEVIRGPGGTLWGANANNGVINIITKSAHSTQGGYFEAGGGTEELAFGGARYGYKLSENGYLRGYLKGGRIDNRLADWDNANSYQAGFRADWDLAGNLLTFQGDYLRRTHDALLQYSDLSLNSPLVRDKIESNSGNVMFRFSRELGPDSEIQFRTYYDRAESAAFVLYEDRRENYDAEFQHRLGLPWRQNLTYGFGYRYSPVHITDGLAHRFVGAPFHWQIFNAFVQDEVELVEDTLKLTFGTKVEHHDPTGWELHPSGRLLWLVSPKQTAWASVSRAIQVPSVGRSFSAVLPAVLKLPVGPVFQELIPNPDLRSQKIMSYEVGYRFQPTARLSLDAAAFYSDYEDAWGLENQRVEFRAAPVPHLRLPVRQVNTGRAHTTGAELAAEFRATEHWRTALSYSYVHVSMNVAADLYNPGDTPAHQVSLRNSIDLPRGLELDIWLRFVDRLTIVGAVPLDGIYYNPIPAYFDMDVRVGWNASKNLSLSIVGQNLLDSSRREFKPNPAITLLDAPVSRGVYGMLSYRF